MNKKIILLVAPVLLLAACDASSTSGNSFDLNTSSSWSHPYQDSTCENLAKGVGSLLENQKVKAVVTALNDTTAISGNRFAIQNGDFAVLVAGSLPSGVEVGDSVEVIGQPLLMGENGHYRYNLDVGEDIDGTYISLIDEVISANTLRDLDLDNIMWYRYAKIELPLTEVAMDTSGSANNIYTAKLGDKDVALGIGSSLLSSEEWITAAEEGQFTLKGLLNTNGMVSQSGAPIIRVASTDAIG